jgi:hypothetical protein
MNAPIGHAVAVVQPPPEHKLTGIDRIEAVLRELRGMDRKDGCAPDDSTGQDGSANQDGSAH